jgi:heptosyltransferase II
VTDGTIKILVRSPNWVGDAVMALPVARALKGSCPDCEVHILAKPWVAPIWEQHPDVSRIVPWSAGVRTWRREKYDRAVILPNSFSSAWLAWRAGCKQRVGYATEGRGWLLTRAVAWEPALETWPRPKVYLNLARHAGADADLCEEWRIELRLTPAELSRADQLLGPGTGALVGLAPGAIAKSRRWPADRYAALAGRLLRQGLRVALLGSAGDQDVARTVERQAQAPLLNLAGRTTLREAAAVIRRCDALVSNDSGAMHLAYSQGVPVLVLQGAADPRVTGPFGPSGRVLRDASLECAPCVRNECGPGHLKCMLNLTVDQVEAELGHLLPTAPRSHA